MANNTGAFHIARQLFDSEIWIKKPASWKVIWLYILGRVNYSDSTSFKRGEGFFRFSKELDHIGYDITEDMVKKCLAYLRKKQMISTSRSTRGTRLKVLKYNEFQDLNQYFSTSRGTREARQKHDRSTTIVKECNKVKKEYSPTIIKIVDNFYFEKLKNHKQAIVATTKVLNASYDVVDKLNRIDNVPFDVIQRVIMRSIKDEFWRNQIISLAGLRTVSKNKQTKFMNASAKLLHDYRPAAPTRELRGFKYSCPACENETVEPEYKNPEEFDAYTCKVDGCSKTQLVNGEMIGSTLKFIEKVYKEES